MNNGNASTDIDMDIITVGKVDYTPRDRLGCGAYGTVFRGIGSDGTTVAVKHQFIRKDNTKAQILNEFRIHQELSAIDEAGRVVRLIGMQEHSMAVTIILEFVPESLHSILGSVTPVQAQKYFRQLVIGVEFLHSHLVVHCDLSLKNLLVCNGDLKIADFGRAKQLVDKDQHYLSTECRGTPKFCAPEVCVTEVVPVKPLKLDVWSCGVVLMQLVQNSEDTWREAKTHVQEFDKWNAKKKPIGSDFWYDIPPTVMTLLRNILDADIKKRATIAEIKNALYFKKDVKEPVKRMGAATRSSGRRARYQ